MADEKRSEVVCTKVTEAMALDLLRESVKRDQSVSTFVYLALRTSMYGSVSRRDDPEQSTS